MQHASPSTHTRAVGTLPSPSAVSHGRPRSAAVVLLLLTAAYLLLGAGGSLAQNVQHTKNAPGVGMRSVFKVNPATNALELEVPLGPTSYPQRGGASVAPAINYSSRIWRIAYAGPIMGTATQQGPPSVVGTRVVPVMAENSRMGWTFSLEAPYVETTVNDAMGGEVYDAFGNSLSACPVGSTGNSCCFIDRLRIHMPGGSTQEFRSSDRPVCYTQSGLSSPLPDDLYSVDGSRMRLRRSTNTLYLPDGSYWVLASGTAPAQLFDRNGNRLLNGFTDGLGRTFANPLDPTLGADYTYTVPGVGGAPLSYTFRWRYLDQALTVPLQPGRQLPNVSDDCGNSPCPEPNLFHSDAGAGQPVLMSGGAEKRNPLVLYQIVLPHDPSDQSPQAYTFTYDAYAEIDKVVYPTGGYERFAYGLVEQQQSGTFVYNEGSRGVTDRFVSARGDGSDEVRWRYAWTDDQGQLRRGEITPDLTRTERLQYYTSFGITFWSFTDARAGRPLEERVYNSADQLIRRRLSEWEKTGSDNCPPGGGVYSTCTATRNPRLAKEVELVIEPGGQALAKITTYEYNLTYEFTTGASRGAVNEYDYVTVDPGTAETAGVASFATPAQSQRLRRTEYDYLDDVNSAYRDRNLLGLKTQTRVKDSSGAVVARAAVRYDEYAVEDCPGIINHDAAYGTGFATRGNATGVTSYANAAAMTGAVTSTTHYDVAGNAVNATDPDGNTSYVSYADSFSDLGNGRHTYAYPTTVTTAAPDPTPVPDPAGGPDFAAGAFGSTAGLTSPTVYDFHTGLVISATDANAKTTAYDYTDPLNRLKMVTGPDGGTTTYDYGRADNAGRVSDYVGTATSLDASRSVVSYQYFDGLGRPDRSFLSEGGSPAQYITSDTQYDALGRVRRVSNPYRTSGPDQPVNPARLWTTTEYDALGRVRKVTTPDGARVQTEYDGLRVLVTDQADRQRMSRSDGLGRLAEVWEVKAVDPQKPDPWLETVTFPQREGVPAVSTGYRTTYTYDVLGNLRKVGQGGQQRFFMYDSLGRLVRARNPEQAVNASLDLNDPVTNNGQWASVYGYDANGNLTSRTDARGVQATYKYDGLNRNILVHYAGGGSSTPDVRRHYDQTGAEVNGLGRPWWTEAVGVSATVIDGYDAAGRPKHQTQKFWAGTTTTWEQAPAYGTGLEYNLAGGVTELTYPSGHKVDYQYDAAGRLGDSGTLPAFKGTLGDAVERTYASQVSYGEFGGIREERFGTETPLYHKLHYNRRGQLFDIRLSTASWATDQWDWNRGAVINYYAAADLSCATNECRADGGPDNNGNLRRQQTWVPADDQASVYTYTQQTYEYDALNRLSSVAEAARASNGNVTDSFRQAYDYDRWGNRTINAAGTWLGHQSAQPSELVNEKQFDTGDLANTNRLYALGDLAYADPHRKMRYDAAGNLTYDNYTGRGSRAYDAENRMTSAADEGGGTTSYAYDGDGRRVRRGVGTAGEVWQVYGLGGELLAEYPKDGATDKPRKEYGYRGGELLVTAEPAAAGWGPPPAFTGPDLKSGDPIRLEHLTELRKAVNQLRQHAGLPPYNFTVDPDPQPKVTTVKADHIRQLRMALEAARSRLGLSTRGYEHPTLTEKSSLIYAKDFQELRDQITGAWQGGTSGTDIRWLVSDQLGTPRMVVDKTGSLARVTRHDYLPFGEELYAGMGGRQTTQGYGAADNVRQKFTSKERDAETGLDYFLARHYSSAMGRFTSTDEFAGGPDELFEFEATAAANPTFYAEPANPQTLNKFSYVYNNPYRFVDADGHQGVDLINNLINSPTGQHVIDQAATGIVKSVANTAIAFDNFVQENLSPERNSEAGPRHTELYRPSGRIQALFMKMTDDVSTLAAFAGGRGGAANVLTAEAKETAAVVGAEAKTYQTYTKTNPATGEVYVGRTSGTGTPFENVARRDASHHRTAEGFGRAQLDRSSTSYDAIRGREQMVLESNRARGIAARQINGISPTNPNRQRYMDAATRVFGRAWGSF